MFPYRKLLFKVSGSIAAFKACALISKLVKDGIEVRVVATPSALKFVGGATFEGLTGNKVYSETFHGGEMMAHIHLDRWADAVILCPASANTINQMAAGIGDDLVKALFLAHDFSKPYFLVPAMNEKMWNHPATRKSIATLKEYGVRVLSPSSGSLACGEFGEGRMLEPEQIYEMLGAKSSHVRVLITAGGTREPIDSVRFIGNSSTGSTAATICDELVAAGFQVTLLKSESAVTPNSNCEVLNFSTFEDFRKKLLNLVSKNNFATVVHAAAVSDYSVGEVLADGKKIKKNGKLKSGEAIALKLKSNPKLIDQIKKVSKNRKLQLVGFKLTDTTDEIEIKNAVRSLFEKSDADVVVHNDVSGISRNHHSGKIIKATGKPIPFASKKELAAHLRQVIEVNL